MKKKILLFTAVAGMGYLVFSSSASGPATSSLQNCTGAKGSGTTCGVSGCHGSGTGTTITITLDSAGVATTRYKPGMNYTVKIHGTNTSMTKFGFQFVAVSGTGSAQVNAGSTSSLPTGVANHTHAASGLSITEHNTTLVSTSASNLDVQFTWTAPSSAIGTITMYSTLNAVNGNTSADGADRSANTSVTLTPITTTSVANLVNTTSIAAYPNPVAGMLNLQAAEAGVYSVKAYDLNGRIVAAESVTINGTVSLNTSNWPAGLYQVSVEKDGNMQVIPVVKQ